MRTSDEIELYEERIAICLEAGVDYETAKKIAEKELNDKSKRKKD